MTIRFDAQIYQNKAAKGPEKTPPRFGRGNAFRHSHRVSQIAVFNTDGET
jgi:hypothetical protein